MLPVETPETNFTYHLPGGTKENDLPCTVDDTSVKSAWEVEEDEKQHVEDWDCIRVTIFHSEKPRVEVGWQPDELMEPLGGTDGEKWVLAVPLSSSDKDYLVAGGWFYLKVHARPTPPVNVVGDTLEVNES